MTAKKWPGRCDERRAGNAVLEGTRSHSIENHGLQRRADLPCRLVGWRVSRWLAVEMVEVANG